mmetsp:Transcript_38002/g.78978  ORF Transcript_38002/g.78978 Transcript_38002/m.78978 type:complete len:255 (+) Transcript_38002:1186-1950(+)
MIWFVLLLTGFGMEAFFLYPFVSSEEGMHRIKKQWSHETELRWRMAQFAFPIFALVSLGLAAHSNHLCILTTVLGLWKFGFPESLTFLYDGIFVPSSEHENHPPHRRIENLLNGFGVVIHHTSASSIIAFVLVGVITPSRNVMDPIFILILQHCFVMVRYIHEPTYIVVCLVLEAFFEWAVLSHFEALCANHWTTAVAGATMLLAHWLFLIAGAIYLFYKVMLSHQSPETTSPAALLKSATRDVPAIEESVLSV